MKKNRNRSKTFLLGLGLDAKDGHKRITRGEDFAVIGGSKETHEHMQEKAVKISEHIRKRKSDEPLSAKEFKEIAEKVGL